MPITMSSGRRVVSAVDLLPDLREALAALIALRVAGPRPGDYRIEGAREALTTAVALLTKLEDGTL